VTIDQNGGTLWHSADGLTWKVGQRFNGAKPIDVYVASMGVYVGTNTPGGRGVLWGPPPPSASETGTAPSLLEPAVNPLAIERLRSELDTLDGFLSDGLNYRANRGRLLATLQPLALSRMGEIGAALSARLGGQFPDSKVKMFGGQLTVPAARMARWYLLWAIALNGHGRISPDLLLEPWRGRPNRPGKYLYLPSAATWTVAELGQADDETIGALIAGLGSSDRPLWSAGDFVGALTALTDQRFGYDTAAWQAWWERRKTDLLGGMIQIPEGTLLMGSDSGEPAEQPVHRVGLSPFSIDRFEVTNAEFTAFVAATGHITSPETSGVGWHWDGEWREFKGADWRHPHGSSSSIQGLERHPVVQVSWIDAQAYCRWRSKRLPTEAEWERAARGDGGRTYPWGSQPPHEENRYRASYGSEECCRADPADGYQFTAPVGSFSLGRSPFGLEDMAGNVWEWVEDWFDQDFYSQSPFANPVNESPGKKRVIRGGGWGNNPSGLRSTLRHANRPDIGLSMVGFRCAR
jgi:formylglycine-generating enzyme required for sulfatase activity